MYCCPGYRGSLPGRARLVSNHHHRRPITCSAAHNCDVAVVGGGAAGLTAAYFAAKAGARVILLEKNDEAGKKILISGGSRCNVLPLSADIASDFFTESSPSALRSVFSRWSLEECRDWLAQDVGIRLALEESTGKLFPASNSANEVRDKLLAACHSQGVKVVMSAALDDLQRTQEDDGWQCILAGRGGNIGNNGSREQIGSSSGSGGRSITATRVVLALGGKSFPTLGTIGTGYDILSSLGHQLRPPYPALTPLLGSHPGGEMLPGISVANCELAVQEDSTSKKKKKGGKKVQVARRTALLLTHRGFSGPAVLDLSHNYVMAEERGEPTTPTLAVSWTRDVDWEKVFKESSGTTLMHSLVRHEGIPARLADALCVEAGVPQGRKLSELRKEERVGLLQALSAYPLPVRGHEGYPKAEVTGGGVPLNELNCSTMESRVAPGVHVCGELCDVHGRIGGFNFYWAWVSGRLAGLGAGEKLEK